MSSKVAKLVSAYRQHLTVPWQAGLAAIQRVIFAVYDKTDELRLRANVEEFALVTQQASKKWLLLDLTNAFPEWMAAQEYRDAYFESPEDLVGYQTGELTEFVAALTAKLKSRISAEADADTARSLAKLPTGVFEHLKELSTQGKRHGSLHAAAGKLGAGVGDKPGSIRRCRSYRPNRPWPARLATR